MQQFCQLHCIYYTFLVYLNWKLKGAILIACRPCVVSSVRKLFTFSSSPEPFSTKFGTMHPLVNGIQNYSKEGPWPFPMGYNYDIQKIHWQHLKNFFSGTTKQIWFELFSQVSDVAHESLISFLHANFNLSINEYNNETKKSCVPSKSRRKYKSRCIGTTVKQCALQHNPSHSILRYDNLQIFAWYTAFSI